MTAGVPGGAPAGGPWVPIAGLAACAGVLCGVIVWLAGADARTVLLVFALGWCVAGLVLLWAQRSSGGPA